MKLTLFLSRFVAHRRWLHIYRCSKARYQLVDEIGFAEMCFECDCWFTKSWEWEDHCKEHLAHPEALIRCDPLIFHHAPIKAGWCPFCLGNKKLQSSKRMVQFFVSPPEWHDHVAAHLNQLKGNFKCEHPACLVDFGSASELTYHLIDTHCWRPRREYPKKRKFELEDTS